MRTIQLVPGERVYVGIDPGLGTCGIAVAAIDERGAVRPLMLRVLKTEKTGRPMGDDIALRTKSLLEMLHGPFDRHYVRHILEAVSPPRSASAATKLAAGWATIATAIRLGCGSLTVLDPREWRRWFFGAMVPAKGKARPKALGGGTEVDKRATVRHLIALYPAVGAFFEREREKRAIMKADQEHAADAFAIMLAGASIERAASGGLLRGPLPEPPPKPVPKTKARPRGVSVAARGKA